MRLIPRILLSAVFVITSMSAGATASWAAYIPPIGGVDLGKYTAYPQRHLVIVTRQGTIKLQLFEKLAPNHVANIIRLAKAHFYDSLTFQRVIPGFMIQGGYPAPLHRAEPPMINAEFNDLHHWRGVLSMARNTDNNSASCQFFIVVKETGFLDKRYTAFGQVVEGMDAVDEIVNLPDATRRKQEDINAGGTDPGEASQMIRVYVEGD